MWTRGFTTVSPFSLLICVQIGAEEELNVDERIQQVCFLSLSPFLATEMVYDVFKIIVEYCFELKTL